jgi:hypothetical protein
MKSVSTTAWDFTFAPRIPLWQSQHKWARLFMVVDLLAAWKSTMLISLGGWQVPAT